MPSPHFPDAGMFVDGFSVFGFAGNDEGGFVVRLEVGAWVACGVAINNLEFVGEVVSAISAGKSGSCVGSTSVESVVGLGVNTFSVGGVVVGLGKDSNSC